jgi:prolyl-tRNA synthetase
MRWTQSLIPTQKENPADAQIVSHQLMIRAGLIRQLTAGAYDFLPLGFRSLRKAAQIVREEMDAIGAAEMFLPALQPHELWQQSGRDIAYGDNLMKFKDRHGRMNVLGPTHEEVTTEMVMGSVNSYKQLPLSLYQIQTKFRDEYRPRFGLLRVREFLMKDAYSFHATIDSLNQVYDQFYEAYKRIFTRCGVPFVIVEAESGPIGGSASHEFMAACEAGEDTIVTSDKGNYAANVEKAEIGERPAHLHADPKADLREVHTPGASSIDDLCAKWPSFGGGKLKKQNVLKTLVYRAVGELTDDEKKSVERTPSLPREFAFNWIAVVRGDHEVNEAKLRRELEQIHKRPMTVSLMEIPQAEKAGFSIGFVGPHAYLTLPLGERARTRIIVDPDAAQGSFWVTGANKKDYHVMHFNWARECPAAPGQDLGMADSHMIHIRDIRNAIAGDPSPKNDGGKLVASKGIEIGHVFKLGTKYSDALGALFLDDKGEKHPMIMGCYGIGVGRILIAAVEALHDDKGIVWPAAIAPFSVVITPIKYDGEVKAAADKLYEQLNAAGIDTLLDDRDARPGVKFNDADLIGFPVRINVGDRGLKEGKVEMKKRTVAETQMVALEGVVEAVRGALK